MKTLDPLNSTGQQEAELTTQLQTDAAFHDKGKMTQKVEPTPQWQS